MIFLLPEKHKRQFDESFNIVKKSSTPFKEILGKGDLTDYAIMEEDKAISFENIFQLKVNVKHSGSFTFLFKKEGFDKEGLINQILPLKEMPIKTEEEVHNKIATLFSVVKESSPICVMYSPNGKNSISVDALKILSEGFVTFYIQPNQEEEAKETSFKFENPFKVIAKEKFHFLFSFVATFLIGFTSSIAIYNIYASNMIYIFFFICALAGMVLNAFIYYDTTKAHKLVSMYGVLTILCSLIGFGGSIGGYILFKNLNKDAPKVLPKMWLILLVILCLCVISAFASLLIKLIKKKKVRK